MFKNKKKKEKLIWIVGSKNSTLLKNARNYELKVIAPL